MLVKIGEVVRQVALITILAAFLEMLLPERKMTRYVRLVLGLFVVVAILTPLVEWLRYGSSLDVVAWDLRLDTVSATAVQKGLEMAAENENAALQVYRDRLASQIKALVTLVPGVKSAEVLVDVASERGYRGIIQRVAVVAYLEEPEKQEAGGPTSLIEVERVKVVKPEIESGESSGAYQDKQPLPGEGEKINGIQGGVGSPVPDNQLLRENDPSPENKDLQAGAATFTPAEVQQIKVRITDMITHFYGLDPGKVEVQVLPQAVDR